MVYPPLGLWYLGAQIEAQGHKTDFFDLSVDSLPKDGEYDQMWITATSAQLFEVRRLSQECKGFRKTLTVLGGPAVWSNYRIAKELDFDVFVVGEADHPLSVHQILSYKKGISKTLYAPTTPTNLDHIIPPIGSWRNRYFAYLEHPNGNQIRTTTMFTSRGCPMACAFCESGRNGTIWGSKVRFEPMESVEQQIYEIASSGDFGGIMFYDDILPLNKVRMKQIMDLLSDYGLFWRCFLRTDIIHKLGGKEYLAQMADSGLLEVLAGVESADNRIKNNIHKGTNIDQDTLALRYCKELGIKFKASLILGLPGETLESMETTRKWVLENRPDRVDVNTLIPFPGTPISRDRDQYDVQWSEEFPEEFWYKGPRDEAQTIVSTTSLTSEQIRDFRNDFVNDLERLGIPY